MRKQAGFTLTETILVICVVALLIVAFLWICRETDKQVDFTLEQVTAWQEYYMAHVGEYAPDQETLELYVYPGSRKRPPCFYTIIKSSNGKTVKIIVINAWSRTVWQIVKKENYDWTKKEIVQD